MKKINFQNGSEGKTPLNKTNMNLLQDNVEEAINEVQNNREWKLASNTTIPECNEAVIYIAWGNREFNLEFHILYEYIKNVSKKVFFQGGAADNGYLSCRVDINNSVVTVPKMIDQNGLIYPEIIIYYR